LGHLAKQKKNNYWRIVKKFIGITERGIIGKVDGLRSEKVTLYIDN
jgi:hypothetical protein